MTDILINPLLASFLIPILAVLAGGGIKLLVNPGSQVRMSLHLFVFGTELSLSAVVLCISTLLSLLRKALTLSGTSVPKEFFDFSISLALLTLGVMVFLIWSMAAHRLYQQNFPAHQPLPVVNCFGVNAPGLIAMFFVTLLLAEHSKLL